MIDGSKKNSTFLLKGAILYPLSPVHVVLTSKFLTVYFIRIELKRMRNIKRSSCISLHKYAFKRLWNNYESRKWYFKYFSKIFSLGAPDFMLVLHNAFQSSIKFQKSPWKFGISQRFPTSSLAFWSLHSIVGDSFWNIQNTGYTWHWLTVRSHCTVRKSLT